MAAPAQAGAFSAARSSVRSKPRPRSNRNASVRKEPLRAAKDEAERRPRGRKARAPMAPGAVLRQGWLRGVRGNATVQRMDVLAIVVARMARVAVGWDAAPYVVRRPHVALAASREDVHAGQRQARRTMKVDSRNVRPVHRGMASIAALAERALVSVLVTAGALPSDGAIASMTIPAICGSVTAAERKAGGGVVEITLSRAFAGHRPRGLGVAGRALHALGDRRAVRGLGACSVPSRARPSDASGRDRYRHHADAGEPQQPPGATKPSEDHFALSRWGSAWQSRQPRYPSR